MNGIDTKTYIRKIVIPGIVGTLGLTMVALIIQKAFNLSGIEGALPYMLPLVPLVYVLLYPKMKMNDKKVKINSKIPFFATYFAVLSTSDVSRSELVWNLATEPNLEPISSDFKVVHTLMTKFHLSMPEALRFLAKRTPSKMFANFLERLAYSLDSGVELKDYLLQEQKTVMDDYQNFYEGALYDLEVLKEVYSSLIISVVFIATFVIIGPMITGQSVLTLSLLMIIMTLIIEASVIMVVKYRMPDDPLWLSTKELPVGREEGIKTLAVSLIGIAVMAVLDKFVLSLVLDIPILLQAAIVMSPLMYAGKKVEKVESIILLRNETFPAFIRTLSSSLAASGAALHMVLKYLSFHNFGVLTDNIKRLYRRMAVRIDNDKAWQFFTKETKSWLIGMFIEIFRKSINLGADPDYVGIVLSRNFERLVRLRRKRQQNVSSFKGVIYGITGAFAFSVAAAFQVAVYMSHLFTSVSIQSAFLSGLLTMPSPASIELMGYLLAAVLLVHTALSSLVLKIADGGHPSMALYYFVILLWLAGIGQYLGNTLMSKVMSFAPAVLAGVIP
ncbi:MAG: archaellar assembly protein FlaJ [Thermococci archaeon]|nr:archaellar assembly protein FlaJ [Thermococci archaeon]